MATAVRPFFPGCASGAGDAANAFKDQVTWITRASRSTFFGGSGWEFPRRIRSLTSFAPRIGPKIDELGDFDSLNMLNHRGSADSAVGGGPQGPGALKCRDGPLRLSDPGRAGGCRQRPGPGHLCAV